MEKFPTLTNDLISQIKWFQENKTEKTSGIKEQKFLLFYNMFCLINQKEYNFTSLKAWKNGPVYTQVHSAVKHHYTYQELFENLDENDTIDQNIAHVTKFIVDLMSNEEISEVTHTFDFWKNVVNKDEPNIQKDDISINDQIKLKKIFELYDLNFILGHKIITTENSTIIVKKEEYNFIKNELKEKLDEIKADKPIKIELDEKLIKLKEKYDLYGIINEIDTTLYKE